MFGPSLLICAVTEPMYYGPESTVLNREKTWECYLPAGTIWYDYWTNEKYEGGQYVKVETPIDRIPIFVKAGAIIPVAESLCCMRMKEITITLRMGRMRRPDSSGRMRQDSW